MSNNLHMIITEGDHRINRIETIQYDTSDQYYSVDNYRHRSVRSSKCQSKEKEKKNEISD